MNGLSILFNLSFSNIYCVKMLRVQKPIGQNYLNVQVNIREYELFYFPLVTLLRDISKSEYLKITLDASM